MASGMNRRAFSQAAAVTTTALSLAPGRVLGANDQVRLGFIGVGNRGCQLLKGFLAQPDAQVVALCDVYAPYLNADYDKVDPRFANLERRIPRMPDGARRRGPGEGLPGRARPQGHRRGGDRHARPLARDPDDRGVQGRQGRLRREAPVDHDRRGPGDGRGRAEARPDRPGRHASAVVTAVHAARRGGPLGGDRQGDRGPGRRTAAT